MIIGFLLSISILIFGFPADSLALELTYPNFFKLQQTTTLPEFVVMTWKAVLAVSFLAALFMLIFGGIKRVLSAGNITRIKDANSIVSSAFIGLGMLLVGFIAVQIFAPELAILKEPGKSPVPLTTECSDTKDNDGDGFTDFPQDPDCASAKGLTEASLSPGEFRSAIKSAGTLSNFICQDIVLPEGEPGKDQPLSATYIKYDFYKRARVLAQKLQDVENELTKSIQSVDAALAVSLSPDCTETSSGGTCSAYPCIETCACTQTCACADPPTCVMGSPGGCTPGECIQTSPSGCSPVGLCVQYDYSICNSYDNIKCNIQKTQNDPPINKGVIQAPYLWDHKSPSTYTPNLVDAIKNVLDTITTLRVGGGNIKTLQENIEAQKKDVRRCALLPPLKNELPYVQIWPCTLMREMLGVGICEGLDVKKDGGNDLFCVSFAKEHHPSCKKCDTGGIVIDPATGKGWCKETGAKCTEWNDDRCAPNKWGWECGNL